MSTKNTITSPSIESETSDSRATGRRRVRRQARKLTYLAPHAFSVPRVTPVGYETPEPENLPSTSMRAARVKRGLTIRELSRRSGISPSTIYRIEQGKTGPRPHVARAISAVFDCSPWEIDEFRDLMAGISLPR